MEKQKFKKSVSFNVVEQLTNNQENGTIGQQTKTSHVQKEKEKVVIKTKNALVNNLSRFYNLVKPFNEKEEKAYRLYKYSQLLGLGKTFAILGFLLCVSSVLLISIYMKDTWRLQIVWTISLCLCHVTLFFCFHFKLMSDKCAFVFVLIAACSGCFQICGYMMIELLSFSGGYFSGVFSKFGWILVSIHCVFVFCPVPYYICVFISLSVFTLHSAMMIASALIKEPENHDIFKQIAANFMYYIVTTTCGSVTFFMIESMHRTSYKETISSLTTKRTIEEELQQQERLLTSVLPKHVAEEIVRDFGGEMVGPFRKMYMMRHENVSILFADIVGFTVLSSKCSAADLVQLLNDLFANFDNLSQKFGQLRLKILGDCYYCICGVPRSRDDHAAMSVYMGLAMVDAISYVREKTKTEVNMRVGIHTGAVLGGVLGQRQWQFDVLGKDVVIANKMESSGVPGRVHICHITKNKLHGEFELEEANIGKQHSFVIENNLKTYLVTKVLKQFKPSLKNFSSVILDSFSRESKEALQIDNAKEQLDYLTQLHSSSREQRISFLTLRLHNKALEHQYQRRQQHCPEMWCICFLVFLIVLFCGNAIVNSVSVTTLVAYLVVCTAIITGLLVCQSRFMCKAKLKNTEEACQLTRKNIIVRTAFVFLILVMIVIANSSTFLFCQTDHDQWTAVNQTLMTSSSSATCGYPYYYTYTTVVLVILLSTVTILDYIIKLLLFLSILVYHTVCLLYIFHHVFDSFDQRLVQIEPSAITQLCNTIGIVFTVGYLDRQIEQMSRKHFLTREDIKEEKQKVIHLKRKTEALVYNTLPAHVAKEFLGRDKNHHELYSQAYNDVGVMFAACPNFEEFYSETSINKDGLECLRFLNEIISDYDELLKEERFKSICKIKTIASTYMVASGLDNNYTTKQKALDTPNDGSHIDDLVQYAFAMKETLNRINAQSFNDFDLKIGINCGSVVAGVIGAKKPHYDIWGNTVNVASRMESTCELGKIQVVQETKETLCRFGYKFEPRGIIKVKGKGELLTFYLTCNRKSEDTGLHSIKLPRASDSNLATGQSRSTDTSKVSYNSQPNIKSTINGRHGGQSSANDASHTSYKGQSSANDTSHISYKGQSSANDTSHINYKGQSSTYDASHINYKVQSSSSVDNSGHSSSTDTHSGNHSNTSSDSDIQFALPNQVT